MAQVEQLVVSITEKGALQVQRSIVGIGNSAQTAGGSVQLLQRALGGLAVLGITASLGSAVNMIAKFSQETSTLASVIGNVSTDKFDELTAKARELGASTRYTATQAAESMTELARAGFKADQVLAAVGPTLTLAQSGALGLAEAAKITANVLAGFNIQAAETQRVVDVLSMAANNSNTDVTGMGEAMSYVAPVANSMKVSLEETASAIELLANAGMDGSRAGTNLTTVLRMLSNPGGEQIKVLEELGLTIEDLSVETYGLTGALENFRKAGATTRQTFDYFNRSAAAATILLRGTNGEMQKFTEQNQKAAGTAKTMADIMDNNLNGAILEVQSAWEGVILSFAAQGSESELTKSLRGLADVLQYVGSHLDSTGKYLAAFAVSVAAVKFAPLLQGLSASAAATIALQKATLAGNAVILGSAQAQTMKAAATATAAQVETAAAVQVAQAEATKTASMLSVIPAQNAQTMALAEAAGAEAAYITLMERRAAMELKHMGQLQALAATEAQHAVATEAAAAAQVRSAAATSLATSKMALFNGSMIVTRATLGSLFAMLAANPIAVGLIAAAGAAAIAITYFDKLKDIEKEIEATEEKTHQMRLQRVQSQVKEIQTRKANEAALETYKKELEHENYLLSLNDSKREDVVDITRAEELAKRKLSDTEVVYFETLNRVNKELKQEKGMLDSITTATRDYQRELGTLNRLKAKGQVDDVQYAQKKGDLQEQYGQTDKMEAYLSKLNAETEALKSNNDERRIKEGLAGAAVDVDRPLSGPETVTVTAKLEEKFALEDVKRMYEQIQGPQLAFAKNEALINQLAAAGSISQGQKVFQLKQLEASLGGYEVLIDNMRRESELLSLTEEERKRRQFLLQAEAQATSELSTEQKNEAWAQEQANQRQYEYNELVKANRSPMLDMQNQMSMLNLALDKGDISQQAYNASMKDIKQTMESLQPDILHMSTVLDSMWGNASSAIDTFVDTGMFRFKDFANSVISDITKMAAKMAMLQAFKGLGGAFGSMFDIGGFATGGSFTVGGSGGTDSQLVAFRASPGEQVDISTPAQQSARQQGEQAQNGPSIYIINVVDPSEVPAIMASAAGQEAIVNAISLNRSSVRQAIS